MLLAAPQPIGALLLLFPALNARCATANQNACFSVCPALTTPPMETARGTPRLSATLRHFRFRRGGDVTRAGRGHVRAAGTRWAREPRYRRSAPWGCGAQRAALSAWSRWASAQREPIDRQSQKAAIPHVCSPAAFQPFRHRNSRARVNGVIYFIRCLCSFINTCDIENVTTRPKKSVIKTRPENSIQTGMASPIGLTLLSLPPSTDLCGIILC